MSRHLVNEGQPPLILHVIHHLVIGGMENGLVTLINRIPTSEYRHAVVCIEDYSEFRNRINRPDVEVVPLHRSKVGVWAVRRAIFEICRRLHPSIVHSRNQSGLDALLPARLSGVKHCIHGEHGWDIDNIDGRKFKPLLLRRLHSPLIERYVTVSLDLQRYLTDKVGIRSERIVQIYNGVDTDIFEPGHLRERDALPAHFRDDDVVIVGTVGRAQPVKDQVTLLRALAHLRNTQPELGRRIRLAFVGDGPSLPVLQSAAEELSLQTQVWFAGATNDVPRLLRLMDVFVLASLNEGISNTILEAMATALPVIATRVGGNVELVEDGVTGALFKPRDAQALAACVAAYVGAPELRRRHGRAGRLRAQERFSLHSMIDRYRKLYDSVLAQYP